jgi:hypothetical protein
MAAVVIALTVIVLLAVGVLVAVLVRRALPQRDADRTAATVIRVAPEPGELPTVPRALNAPVRLPQDQLEQLAEMIRRGQRPE